MGSLFIASNAPHAFLFSFCVIQSGARSSLTLGWYWKPCQVRTAFPGAPDEKLFGNANHCEKNHGLYGQTRHNSDPKQRLCGAQSQSGDFVKASSGKQETE